MKRFLSFLTAITLLLTIAALSSCNTADNAETEAAADTALPDDIPAASPAYPIIAVDMAGREVVITKPADKIVVLSPADCEIIYAIGAGDTVKGRGAYCDYPEDVQALPEVQSGYETNIEQIIALSPEAVVMTVMSQQKEHVKMLEDAGITVIVTDAQDINGVYAAIELMGKVTGKSDEAAKLANELKQGFSEIKAQNRGQTVYFEVSPLQYGLWTTGSGTFMNEIAQLLGLYNIFAQTDGWAEVSQEQVIDKNPDYIITIGMYDENDLAPITEIKSRPGWEGISAVVNDRVFILPSDEISRPGPRLLTAAHTINYLISE